MSGYEIRPYVPSDEPEVLGLMKRALGWRDEDPNAELFRWKHRDSAFGPSPAWVAVEGGRIIGFRTFMRWEFEEDGRIVRAVRAVDTATDPAHQGRGIFKTLTLRALDELREEGVAFVFNTPNDQSRPGYLKMGWHVVGTLPVRARPRSAARLSRLIRARVPAALVSEPTTAGQEAGPAFAAEANALGRSLPGTVGSGMRTNRTPGFLRWRYGLPALQYRGLPVDDLSNGLIVFRLRRRGPALEAALCDVVGPATTGPTAPAVRRLLQATHADYAIALGDARGMVRIPGHGPVLTCLPLDDFGENAVSRIRWSLGDIELF